MNADLRTCFRPLRGFRLLAGVWLGVLLAGCDSGGGGGGASGPQTVLVMGDSISGSVNYPGVAPWPSRMAELQPEWTILNRARRGETSGQAVGRVSAAVAETLPDTVVLFYGSNDAIRSRHPSFESNLVALIERAGASGARVAVCTLPPLYGYRDVYNGNVSRINETIRRVAPHYGAKVIRVDREFGPDSGERFPDGLHPDAAGQFIIAVTVAEKL